MRNHLRFCITCILLGLLFGGCVSVQLPGGKVTSAKDVQLSEPKSPFEKIKAVNADRAWLSSKTGNTISYLSECGGPGDMSLQAIENESLSAMNKLQTVSSETLIYNGREARQSISKGELDGVPVQMALLIFKKNGCTYTMTYGGLQKQFPMELNDFEKFKVDFKAP
ncbi:hypothetical protein [Bdellovibrio svalbardensis]|uniref:hypothetical protein n=1 Tax=Bdellovibrio svalbardensis TaxID=2972972 RepID=UPI002407CD10|nr:hypothetical protein [Bdellovibrio svalbardensis]